MDNNSTRDNTSTDEHGSSTSGPNESSPRTMFSPQSDAWEETRQAERKRIAIWGLATGGVMAAVLALCVLLAYLASSA